MQIKRTVERIKIRKNEQKKPKNLFGYLKNSITVKGDIISPFHKTWNAEGNKQDK